MKDISGRAYATVSATAPGAMLEADGDFTCMREGTKVEVKADPEGLYVPCSDGQHYLNGQVETDAGASAPYYVGLYPAS